MKLLVCMEAHFDDELQEKNVSIASSLKIKSVT